MIHGTEVQPEKRSSGLESDRDGEWGPLDRREEPLRRSESGDSSTAWGTEIIETTVLGHPCSIFARHRHHLADLLIDGRRYAEREYLVCGERRLTFAAHEGAVATVSELLSGRGIRPQDRVLLHGANAAGWVIAFWAILDVGAIVVLGNAWWSNDELRHAIDTTEPRLVITDRRRADQIPEGVDTLLIEDAEGSIDPGLERVPRPILSEDDPAVVLFTSGTTGAPKGAVLSHRGIIATLQALAIVTKRLTSNGLTMPAPSRSLLSLPLFHVGGLQQILNPMLTGGTLVFTEGAFDPKRVVELIDEEQIAVWSAVPTMVSRVINHLAASGRGPVRGVRTLGLGGSPVPDTLRRAVSEWFPDAASGPAITYGLSEAGGVVATGIGAELQSRPGCVGKPLPCTTIRIADTDESGVGEVLVRSPSVMLGYWQPGDGPELADESTISSDRWLRTGDIGKLEGDGYLYILDRRKDVVIRGGENIATPHVEERLLEHPAVDQATVVGLPHSELGEELGAVVVLRRDARATSEGLAEFCAEKLAYFEVPTKWRFRTDELPQNDAGKILKRAVRDEWISSLEADA